MRIAVTGANGHVGVNLVKKLTGMGHEVTVLAHKNTSFLKGLNIKMVQGDVLDPSSLDDLMQGADTVFHLAAVISIHGDKDGRVGTINVQGPRNMTEAAKRNGVKKFIHFSSIHAFRQFPHDVVLDEVRPLVDHEGFAYDRSKAEGERIVRRAAENGLDAVVLNPTAIIGPSDPEPSLIGKAILALYQNRIPALVPGGYNWVDVRDVVDGAIAAMEHGRKGEKYLLSGTYCGLPELSAMISRIGGVKTPSLVTPFWLAKIGLPFISAYSKITGNDPLYTGESLKIIMEGNKQISSEKARRELNYQPRSLEVTLADFIDWFKENGFIK